MTTEATPVAPSPGEQAPSPGTVPAGTPPAAPPADPPSDPLVLPDPNAKTEPGPKDTPAEGVVQYNETGDTGLDMALEFVGNLGIGPEDPAMVKAGQGDFSALAEKLKGLGDKAKGFEKFLKLAEKALNDQASATKAQRQKDTEALYKVVGGEKEWQAISKWAGTNAEPAERENINKALAAGGMQAKAMALYLSTLYSKAAGTTVNPAAVVVPGAAPAVPSVGAPLSPAQYQNEIAKLSMVHGPGMIRTPEYKALVARRQAFRG